MNFKKLLVLLLFAIAIIGIIAPVNANLEAFSGIYELNKGKAKVYLYVNSNIGSNAKDYDSANYVSKRKAELNNVNKVVVSIKGYTPKNFKKPSKGWKTGKYGDQFEKIFSVKGNPLGKSYSIKLYNKNNKLLKQVNGKALPGN